MTPKSFFPTRPDITPTIYVYELIGVSTHEGLLKIGYTDRDARTRITEQLGTAGMQYCILLESSAMRNDWGSFTDHDIHRYLRKKWFTNPHGEWFACTVRDIEVALVAIKSGIKNEENRTLTFGMRPEQSVAVQRTVDYFESYIAENPGEIPHFLWNAKMRFGKTFTSYQLALRMGWSKILVLTFKPAVESAWDEDLRTHVDFEGWQFISNSPDTLFYTEADRARPMVCFGSFQDYLGKNAEGGIKPKNEWVHTTQWDCVIFDEYHYGSWRENAKDLFESEDKKEQTFAEWEGIEYFDEGIMPITTNHYLYLSGTPFRAIADGEFIEEQIFNWTYSDEQRAKNEWMGVNNPYAALPRMVMMTYQLPESIREVARGGEFDGFDLNIFFGAEWEGSEAKFRYKDEVQKWLDLIRGSLSDTTLDTLKLGVQKPPFPFSHAPLLRALGHTFWFLPTVSSCHAMANLLAENQNIFYHEYKVVVCAGSAAGIGMSALPPVLEAMTDNPLKSKTITLSCGKLTTGVSVKPWTGIFMLRNSSSPETYFQAAFRVQTPWTIHNPDSKSPNQIDIIKEECYVFDFAPDRALRQIQEYSCRLNISEDNPERRVAEFINFLPVLAYDGSSMKQIDAAGVLDIAMSGTTATLLARRWESALLVNVDNGTLARLMRNNDAMEALRKIEGFRNLNQDIETLINKSESVKKLKQESVERDLTLREKERLTEDEKEQKSIRKQIQEKLIKFATRIPVFMYLTDYREHSMKDIITQLEPGLFKKVTGLGVEEFELLTSLGVFNSAIMNDAVYKFKRYEDASLSYTWVYKQHDGDVGLFDTVLSRDDVHWLDGPSDRRSDLS